MLFSDRTFLLDCFSTSYDEARTKFLNASRSCLAAVHSVRHPEPGPMGEPLFLDAALIGPRNAEKLFILISGTHGPEGFCGSAAQTGLLRIIDRKSLSPDVALLLIHAHNPFGFAWCVRATHENIDLNRNFVDHNSLPGNGFCDRFYQRLGPMPDLWSDEFLKHFESTKQRFISEHGRSDTEACLGYGQFAHWQGLHYGGEMPSWSYTALTELLSGFTESARFVAAVDIHTGLGRYGYGELLSAYGPQTENLKNGVRAYGETVRSMRNGDSVASYSTGNVSPAIVRQFSGATVIAHALEFGTYEGDSLLSAKLKCHWLSSVGRLDSEESGSIRNDYKAIFYPELDDWKELVWQRSMMVCRQSLDWLKDENRINRRAQ